MHHAGGDGSGQLDAEIAVGHAVQAVGAGCGKAQLLGGEGAVQRVGGAGQRAGAQRALRVHAGRGILKALQIAQQHPGIGHQRVAEGDGLGALQVGVAGHDGGGVLRCFLADDPDQIDDAALQHPAVVAQGQADVQRHLIVAAAAGVQALAGVADAGGQGLLHEGVDVLGVGVDLQPAAGQVVGDGSQTVEDVLTILLGDDALFGQHGGVYAAAPHILCDHPLVKADGRVEIIDARIDRLGETAFPELFCHSYCSLYLDCNAILRTTSQSGLPSPSALTRCHLSQSERHWHVGKTFLRPKPAEAPFTLRTERCIVRTAAIFQPAQAFRVCQRLPLWGSCRAKRD